MANYTRLDREELRKDKSMLWQTESEGQHKLKRKGRHAETG